MGGLRDTLALGCRRSADYVYRANDKAIPAAMRVRKANVTPPGRSRTGCRNARGLDVP
jgi:hypothetical protein